MSRNPHEILGAANPSFWTRVRASKLSAWTAFAVFALLPLIVVYAAPLVLFVVGAGGIASLFEVSIVAWLIAEAAVLVAVGWGLRLAWKNAFNQSSRPLGYVARWLTGAAGVLIVVPLGFLLWATVLVASVATMADLSSAECDAYLAKAHDDGGRLAAHARCGDLANVRQLAEAGASTDNAYTVGRYRRTPLMHATSGDHTKVIAYLLSRGAKAAERGDDGETALHIAAGKGYPNSVKLLLANGADPNAMHALGSPLHAAVLQGNLASVKLLLSAGADPNLRTPRTGNTPLHTLGDIADVRADHPAIIAEFAAAGADFAAVDDRGDTPIRRMKHELASQVFDYGARLPPGAPPFDGLWLAFRSSSVKRLEAVVAAGTPVDARNAAGSTILHFASRLDDPGPAMRLLGLGAAFDAYDGAGATPLVLAAEHCNWQLVDELIRRGARVAPVAGASRSPAHALSNPVNPMRESCRKTAHLLLDAGAPPGLAQANGDTALHSFVADDELCARLLALGADPRARNRRGETPLHVLATQGIGAVSVSKLVRAGADPNAQDQRGRTPLHAVAEFANQEQSAAVARALIADGARTDIPDAEGQDARTLFRRIWQGHLGAGVMAVREAMDMDVQAAGIAARPN